MMHRKRWTKILIEYGRDTALEMAAEIQAKYTVDVVSAPQEALTMIKMRETAQNTLFYAGEVLITETKVRVDNQPGNGIVQGHEPELSLALAIIDAAFSSQLQEVTQWLPKMAALEAAGDAEWLIEQNQIAQTKVNFETMNQ